MLFDSGAKAPSGHYSFVMKDSCKFFEQFKNYVIDIHGNIIEVQSVPGLKTLKEQPTDTTMHDTIRF